MKDLEKIKFLLRNSDSIIDLFTKKIPLWKSDPKHYDKTSWCFNGDSRFNACNPASISFSSYKGTYGNSGSTSQLDLDDNLFRNHLVKYLNDNKETVMMAISDSIRDEARNLKSKAKFELEEELSKLKTL